MLESIELSRIFKYSQGQAIIELSDPDTNMTPRQVRNFYASTYPELTSAAINGPQVKNDQLQFTFVNVFGIKG